MKLADSVLWDVGIEYHNGAVRHVGLWIVTASSDLAKATAKAQRYLATAVGRKLYPNATVCSIEAKGTIDA